LFLLPSHIPFLLLSHRFSYLPVLSFFCSSLHSLTQNPPFSKPTHS
jgi:hypothetical protein